MPKAHRFIPAPSDTDTEQWRAMPACPEHFSVSDQGRLWSHLWGRVTEHTSRNTWRIHGPRPARRTILVAPQILTAFKGEAPDTMVCLHHDDDLTNNRLANLRWGTRSENQLDAVRNSRHRWSKRPACAGGHLYTAESFVWKRSRSGSDYRECIECRRTRGRAKQRRRRERLRHQEVLTENTAGRMNG